MDPQYLRWFEIYYLQSVPSDKDKLVPAPECTEDLNEQSLGDAFSFVSYVSSDSE